MSSKNIDKPVLITGASTGIGRKTTELLIEKGKKVYACARKEKDIAELNQLPNTTAFQLDVTKLDQISKVAQQIKELGEGLYGLVNNAGIVNLGPIFTFTDKAMLELFDINVFGVHRVTNAMLPFLFESRGRIVNISSISGVLTGQYFGLYSMSKHALEAYSDALFQNLGEAGVEVSIIEPGNFKSEIGKTYYEKRKAEKKEERLFMTDEQHEMQLDELKNYYAEPNLNPEPLAVAEAIYDALYSDNPKPRYLVTGKQEEAEWVMRKMFQELTQMNFNHIHSYKKEELIQMLDDALNARLNEGKK
ncbi:MAG: SDR family NAD(P)-dependent oxidoreductase [Candidatus Heimdallarchaeota archaeon]|nr:SDR family NAD(P)-dependent oxidoreductase [Candidatus Heimdallarchaeota archaeon]MCK4876919.1 SDR family NAD(P)-dependent oxidoreductase [Candidatus Heimdallarchaeota archaeon]